MFTHFEIEIAVCFLIAFVLMIAMSFWFVRIRRSISFVVSVWICFILISGSGFYLARISLEAANKKDENGSENLSVLIPVSEQKPWARNAEPTTSIGFEHAAPMESAFPIGSGSNISTFAPVALFQIVLVLFFAGVYFAAKNDLFRERISSVKEQLYDTTRRWMREKDKSSREKQRKQSFLNNMSHEIRTPLNAILGLTQVIQMRRQTPEETRDTEQEMFEMIHKNGADLIFVVENMILFSSIDSNLVSVQWSEIDFSTFLKELQSDIRKKSLWDDVNDPGRQIIVPKNFPPKLISDTYCLRSILLNLWENAIKFSRNKNVSVRFAIRPEKFSVTENIYETENPQLPEELRSESRRFAPALFAVEVSDSGIGIDQEQRKRIFQPFYQADTSPTRNYNGLGLGLTITKRLTQMLGGKVNVKSEPGKGSQFTLELPTWIEPRCHFAQKITGVSVTK